MRRMKRGGPGYENILAPNEFMAMESLRVLGGVRDGPVISDFAVKESGGSFRTASAALNYARKQGFLVRRRDPMDGKRMTYELTEPGIEALNRAREFYRMLAAWGTNARDQ